jgi:RNA polymerase sigma factor (sigma-70 family)
LYEPVPINQKLDHLFRHESGKLVAGLTRLFGSHNMDIAEDVVQDTLLKALHTWKLHGIPENPSGWLFTAAKNKAIDIIRKKKKEIEFAGEQSYLFQSEYTLAPAVNECLNENTVHDDQLRMMFTCCHPGLPAESQVALILKTLCGFSIAEIAKAFICSPDTIEKRLYRAKQEFREQRIAFEIPGDKDLAARLDNLLTAIYLLFNEGYNSTRHENIVRKDLIEESIRLAELLAGHPQTAKPEVFALLALMCFHHARSDSRTTEDGCILLLKEQNRKTWSPELISRGDLYMERSAEGETLTVYHLEAAISYEYIHAGDYSSTNWSHILKYYDLLYQLRNTPVVALNRAVVTGEVYGAEAGIDAIRNIPGIESLKDYYLYHAIMGDMYDRTGEDRKASTYFLKAAELTSSVAEKKMLLQKAARADNHSL